MPTIPQNRQITASLFIARPDGSTFVDVSDYLKSCSIELGSIDQVGTGNQGGDSVVRSMNFTLQNQRAQIPVWDETTAKDETYVVGDSADVVGDENDGAEKLINLLFDTSESLKGNTFHPKDKKSDWNLFDNDSDGTDEWTPLLWPMREVVFRVAVQEQGEPTQESGTTQKVNESVGTGDGSTTTFNLDWGPVLPDSETVYLDGSETTNYTIDYNAIPTTITFDSAPATDVAITADYTYFRTMFEGYLGDSIKGSKDASTVQCQARDYAKRLQTAYVELSTEYGSESGTAAETVIQNIIDDNVTNPPTLQVPSSPGFLIEAYKIKFQSTWDAIQEVVSQFGWFLGYRLDKTNNTFKLYLEEPPRSNTTGDYILTAEDDFYTFDIDINDADVRNAIKVSYIDSSTGEKESVTVENTNSINEYGRRPMEIGEKSTSLIDTSTEATDLANAALNDLAQLTGLEALDLPLFPQIDLYDSFDIEDRRISTETEFVGIDSVRHEFDFSTNGKFRTMVQGSQQITGAHTRWLKMETRPGSSGNPTGASNVTNRDVIPKPEIINYQSIYKGFYIKLKKPNYKGWGGFEIHVSTSGSGFTPDSSTLEAKGQSSYFEITGLDPATTYYVKVISYDIDNEKSEAVY